MFPLALPVKNSMIKSVVQILNGGLIKGKSPSDYYTSCFTNSIDLVKTAEYNIRTIDPSFV